jgi:heme exporter protein D
MLPNTLSVLSLVISISALLFARRGYLREKARLRALEARYPHLAARATEK